MDTAHAINAVCQEELVQTTGRFNCRDFLLRVFPQPLLHHSPPFSAISLIPVESSHTWHRSKSPCRLSLLQLITALHTTHLVYSRQQTTKSKMIDTRACSVTQHDFENAYKIVKHLHWASGQEVKKVPQNDSVAAGHSQNGSNDERSSLFHLLK